MRSCHAHQKSVSSCFNHLHCRYSYHWLCHSSIREAIDAVRHRTPLYPGCLSHLCRGFQIDFWLLQCWVTSTRLAFRRSRWTPPGQSFHSRQCPLFRTTTQHNHWPILHQYPRRSQASSLFSRRTFSSFLLISFYLFMTCLVSQNFI